MTPNCDRAVRINHLIGIFIGVATLCGVHSQAVRSVYANVRSYVGDSDDAEFPKEFLFGAATASFQIEGAWDADGKSPSIWDDMVHQHPELIAQNASSDVAADSYHLYEDDIVALKATGVNVYRFSIAWTRILPDCVNPNPAGIRYYNRLIDRLLAEGIEPLVTMFHYDLPRCIQKIGGWTNPLVQDYFEAYADILFQQYGDRVTLRTYLSWVRSYGTEDLATEPYIRLHPVPRQRYQGVWITMNEPSEFCINGYGNGEQAPLVPGFDMGAEYLCADNVLKSHARVYHLYYDMYAPQFAGKIGITLITEFFYPEDPSNDNAGELVDRAMQFQLGWFAQAIFSPSADYYPPIVVETVASNSVREGRKWSRLPKWTKEWKAKIHGSADFLGLNYYTSRLVRMGNGSVARGSKFGRTTQRSSIDNDINLIKTPNSTWVRAKSPWLYSVPAGLGDLLRWIRDEYNNPEVIITENGWSDDGQLDDTGRVEYLPPRPAAWPVSGAASSVDQLAQQLLKMRALGVSAISLALTAAVVTNAYYQKKQFYPSVVYITKSNPSMAVIYLQSLVLVLMLGKLMRKVFLGTLRAAEFEHLMERFWYALTETCLAFTVFRDDFNPKFVALFTVLLFLKSFHWLAEDRVDFMERSPIIGWVFHLRASALLSVLGVLDYLMILHAYQSTIEKGATVQLVFGFEYAILFTMVANISIKYILHAAELRAEAPWENKAVFLLYTELVIGLIRVVLYVLFVVIMVRLYTLPLFAFRPMYYTMRNFKKALNDVIMSRRAIRNMNTLYPDATPEELLQSDNICIICREDMVNSSKKLPCGHIFHTSCLRSWFQRQQTCPTCRLNILRGPAAANAGGAAVPGPADAQPAAGAAANANHNNNNLPQPDANLFANLLAPPNLQNMPNFGANNIPMFPNLAANPPAGGAVPSFLPPFPMLSPFVLPPPPMPPALDTLTDEELRTMEGIERRHVEERIKLLRNIKLMLDASIALMNQYSAVTANLPVIPPAPIVEPPAGSASTAAPPTVAPPPQPSTSGASGVTAVDAAKSEPSTSTDAQLASSSSPAPPPEVVKIEDIGSEEHLDQVPSVAGKYGANEVTAELRRRRLEKFTKTEAQASAASNQPNQ